MNANRLSKLNGGVVAGQGDTVAGRH